MIIAIDFDGTLHNGKYPGIGSPDNDASRVIQILRSEGHYIIIWTCREGQTLLEAINWMLEQNIPFDRINDHEPGNKAKYGGLARKVYADIYIDDHQVGGLPSWLDILDYIRKKAKE